MQHTQLNNDQTYRLCEVMRKYGGHFCTKFADLLSVADASNRQRLLEAFPELVDKYGPGGMFDNQMTAQEYAYTLLMKKV
jgi:hypothetical protein